jgi:tetratricopeptide (TPR) repeat protein
MKLAERLGSPLRDPRTAALVVGLVAALVYLNSLWNHFAFDDVLILVDNAAIQHLHTLPDALTRPYWPDAYGRELGLWRPVTTGVYGLLYVVGGGSALPFHAMNVLGHVGVSVLVLLLCAALMPLPASFAAALVFAVHPVHVEAVSNIVGFAEILSALATVVACWLHIRRPVRSAWGHALVLGALYLVAFGAKESGVTLPALIFLVDAARRNLRFADLRGYVEERWRDYGVMATVAVVLLAGRYAVLGSVASPFPPFGADLLAQVPRIWTLGEVWSHYVRLWVFPLDLYADYSPNVIPISLGWNAGNVAGVLVALGVLAAAGVAARRLPLDPRVGVAGVAAFGVAWFVIAVLPTANFFFLSGVILAERTLYLPSVGLAAATGWLVYELSRARPRAAWALLVLALSLGAVRTWTRTPVWRDNQTFFATLLRDAPHAGRSQWILGDSFLRAGNTSQALLAYRLAVNILDGHYQLLAEISQRMMEIERWQTAERLLEQAYRDRPEFALAPSLLAWVRAQDGDAAGTERYARASLARFEEDVTRHDLLAWALAAQGRWEEAAQARARADELGGDIDFWHRWMYLAYVRRHAGDTVGAFAALDSAWSAVATGRGRRAMDSVRVADFGLRPLLPAGSPPSSEPVNR